MQLAEILSDLVSLRVCDPAAALALVSARPNSTAKPTDPKDKAPETETDEQDPDLKRAKELVKLHYGVREASKRGELGRGLEEARAAIERVAGV
ncbi:hypothetical protein BDV95DRAFT_498602 [Massariosphaeria phaeospora]|uniref:Uncharacterized protein n=1 Tax=Massariosphaeria phaeospora TaxID=100035 RepID=A0A7C8MBS5_9PLEO|nr:hypothetical protein BDV95DRAFT_498602 [Massariosphaeria phaeospora]